MAVIARDTVAADQLVYAWPFPIGPEPVEVACGEDELVLMCPAWVVGQHLGPGRHTWRTPDPSKPSNAYFVLTGPVETDFDVMTSFVIPSTQQPVRLRAQGSLLVRCADPVVLISQFVGLPFDNINAGLMRSVSISVERLVSRVLVRRVIAAGSPAAVVDPGMLPSIIDELTAYNPAAGAVSGVAFLRFNQLLIHADDGGMGGGTWNGQPWDGATQPSSSNGYMPDGAYATGGHNGGYGQGFGQMAQPYPTGAFGAETQPYSTGAFDASTSGQHPPPGAAPVVATPPPGALTPVAPASAPPGQGSSPSHEPPAPSSSPGMAVSSETAGAGGVVSGEIGGGEPKRSTPQGPAAQAQAQAPAEPPLLPVGSRVLVSSADGTLHSSTIRQHQQGYYEVEVGATGQTLWLPVNQVIPEGQ